MHYFLNNISFNTSTYISLNRRRSLRFRSVSSDKMILLYLFRKKKKNIYSLPFIPEIDHANMTDRATLVPIVRALRTKLIVGILAAVTRRVRTIYLFIVVTYLHPSLNPGLRRWKGCTCALTGRICGTKRCSCFRANVECDPDVCLSCGTKYVIVLSFLFCFISSMINLSA